MFKVEWVTSALNDLARIWLRADRNDRSTITIATNDIEQRLSTAPETAGESRSDHAERIEFFGPLRVVFHVDTSKGIVTVLSVWRYKSHDH